MKKDLKNEYQEDDNYRNQWCIILFSIFIQHQQYFLFFQSFQLLMRNIETRPMILMMLPYQHHYVISALHILERELGFHLSLFMAVTHIFWCFFLILDIHMGNLNKMMAWCLWLLALQTNFLKLFPLGPHP